MEKRRSTSESNQQSRYAAEEQRSAILAPVRPAPAAWKQHTKASAEKSGLQREPSRAEAPHSERHIITSTDGSNLALEFHRKRMRQIHIDDAGTVTPEGEWRAVNLPAILRWVTRTSTGAPPAAAGFTSVGAQLAAE